MLMRMKSRRYILTVSNGKRSSTYLTPVIACCIIYSVGAVDLESTVPAKMFGYTSDLTLTCMCDNVYACLEKVEC